MEKKSAASVRSTTERPNHIEPLYDSHEVAMRCKVSEKSLHRWAQGADSCREVRKALAVPEVHHRRMARREDGELKLRGKI